MKQNLNAAEAFSPFNQLKKTEVGAVRWTGGFWGERFQQCEDVILPSMFEALNHAENSAVFSNFYVTAGLQEGTHLGTFWSDGDCYKWMEGDGACLWYYQQYPA